MSLFGSIGWGLVGGLALVVSGLLADRRGRRTHLARCCHELRGPLTAARLGLSSPAGGRLDPARLRAVESEIRRAALILDDLIAPEESGGTVARLRPRAVEGGLADLGAVVTDVVEARHAVAAAAGVRLDLSATSVVVAVEPLRLAQALGNLIDNAITHAHSGAQITVQAGPELVRVEVCDDGIGLSEPLSVIVDRGRRRRGRHGHGLAVAARIATRYGGRLATAPSPRGARIVLELPRRAAPAKHVPRLP